MQVYCKSPVLLVTTRLNKVLSFVTVLKIDWVATDTFRLVLLD